MIDLHKLYIFDTVVQTGSFSLAAERLYITQPAVSQHIKDLELGFGQQLFVRGRRGVVLTGPGEVLAEYSRRVFDLLGEAEQALTHVDQLSTGKVSIGATLGVGIYLAPDWVQGFRAQYPRLTVVLQTGLTDQIISDILYHRLEIGVIEGEIADNNRSALGIQAFQDIEQMVIVGPAHPLWNRDGIALEDLADKSFIVRQQGSQSRAWLEQALHENGIRPVIGAEFDNIEAMKHAVMAGRCIAILPPYAVKSEVGHHELRMLSVADRPFVRTLKLIWNARSGFSPYARAFLEYLSRQYPDLSGLVNA